eukprot:Gb_00945 [translate_table: standard]
MLVLIMSVTDEVSMHLQGVKDASKVWDKLKVYETSNKTIMLYLKNMMYSMRMSEGDQIEDHLLRLKDVRDQLATIGTKIEDEEIVALVLNSLPTSYKIFVTSLSISDRTVTFEELVGLLMQEELRNKKQETRRRRNFKSSSY